MESQKVFNTQMEFFTYKCKVKKFSTRRWNSSQINGKSKSFQHIDDILLLQKVFNIQIKILPSLMESQIVFIIKIVRLVLLNWKIKQFSSLKWFCPYFQIRKSNYFRPSSITIETVADLSTYFCDSYGDLSMNCYQYLPGIIQGVYIFKDFCTSTTV